MSEFFFVVKTVLFSALVLMLLQMRVGGSTLEQHTEGWIYSSRVGAEVQTVARGAVRAGFEGFAWVREHSRDVTSSIQQVAAEKSLESPRETRRERPVRDHSRHDDLD